MALDVLLVEDHDESRVALGRLLSMSGLRPTLAAGMREGLELLAGSRFDVLLIDLVLPDGSGLQLVRDSRSLTSAPAIAMTGLGEEPLVQACVEAGFVSHLVKPVVFDELLTAIHRAASQSAVTPSLHAAARPVQRLR
jgi:CheY-like chemotaxis protein